MLRQWCGPPPFGDKTSWSVSGEPKPQAHYPYSVRDCASVHWRWTRDIFELYSNWLRARFYTYNAMSCLRAPWVTADRVIEMMWSRIWYVNHLWIGEEAPEWYDVFRTSEYSKGIYRGLFLRHLQDKHAGSVCVWSWPWRYSGRFREKELYMFLQSRSCLHLHLSWLNRSWNVPHDPYPCPNHPIRR